MRFKPKIILFLVLLSLTLFSTSQAALEIDRGPLYKLLKKAYLSKT